MDQQIVELPYHPRWYQEEFESALFHGKRRAYLLYHRKAGKDIACWAFMINCAIADRAAAYYYVFPSYNQGRKVLWDGIDQDGKRLLDYIPVEWVKSRNASMMKIELVNGSLIQIVGSDDPDSLRGPNVYGAVFSEYAVQNPRAWQEVVGPMIDASKGWVIFNTTPLGKNHAYDLWTTAQFLKDSWYTKKLTIDDTGLISQEILDQRRAEGISEEIIQQEYYCSFDRGIEGSYYGRIITDSRLAGRIGRVIYEPRSSVNTYWDIGYGDSTSIVFTQDVGTEHRIIDYYECSGEGIAHYIKILQSKPYVYGKHYMPFDAGSGSVQTGMSLQRTASDLGLSAVVLPRYDFGVGIEACRSMLSTAYIDERNCKHLIKCLENYHKKYNETLNVYSDSPVHDWSSHGADATRYCALARLAYGKSTSAGLTPEKIKEMRIKNKGY